MRRQISAVQLLGPVLLVVLVGIAIFGGLYAWAQIFATHLFFLKKTHGGADAATAGRTAAQTREFRWRFAGSAVGLAFMVAVIVTTWWVPGFRVTLLCGIPWLALLTVTWRLSRSPS
jgi:L-asparagine transporter-like permease